MLRIKRKLRGHRGIKGKTRVGGWEGKGGYRRLALGARAFVGCSP